jgi:SPP1 gp7 family putative phage head morphogenesis protein
MSFEASKTRQKRPRRPVGEGKTLIPNAAVESWYRGQLRALCTAMVADYRKELKEAIDHPEVERFFALDAATDELFKRVLNRLRRKWNDVFKGAAAKLSTDFVDKVDQTSKTSSWFSMSAMGIEEPRVRYTDSVRQTIDASKDFNFTLITNISEEVHEKVYSAVMLSLTSPDPEQQGVSGITNALREIGKFSEKRIELIARDQNAKLYSSLNIQRLQDNDVEHFRWMHSSAGKVPRQTHLDRDGEVYRVDDPRLWEGPKADQGPPGWAINCRCRMRPLIGYREGDTDDD